MPKIGWGLTPIFIAACTAGIVSNLDTTPTNDLPNPYRTVAPWGKLPEGHKWGALNAVWVDNDGRSLWVADRCGENPEVPPGESPFLYDSCAGSDWPPVHKLDAEGNIVKSFGASLFVFPHKITQDKDGNIWVVDMRAMNARERAKYPDARPAGHTVVKFDPDGRVLLVIGTAGIAGDPPDALTEPCAVVVAPNGDIYVAEGHSGQQPKPPNSVGRISRYSADGRFIRSYGRLGSGPGEFRTPHDLAIEGGRLYVADRGNHRIQILDLEGNYLGEWKQYGRPSGVALRGGLIYVADSESNGVAPNPGWQRGIRIGEAASGRVLYRIPDPLEMKGTSAAEGVAVDAMGNVYGGEVGPRQLVKHLWQGTK
jgi:hypothetical protein